MNCLQVKTRTDLYEFIKQETEEILKLFSAKNVSYGSDQDAFHNFRQTALRLYGNDKPQTMFTVLLTLLDKHLVALANKGIEDAEFNIISERSLPLQACEGR